MILIYHGIQAWFSSTNPGNQESQDSSSGNHKPCIADGLIKKYGAGETFTEYIIEVDRNSYIESDDGEDKLFSFGEIMTPIKREIIYIER